MPRQDYQDFHSLTVPLKESNLIEASAGTGKTYSIAILVLRLVLEKEMSVKDILMVTFTKAAVAELEARIRLFIRAAYRHSTGGKMDDPNIAGLVDKAMAASSVEAVQRRLRDAVLLLDETSVLTIHSFCQVTLTEFAFETRQLFGMELMTDTSLLLEEAVNEFWRRHVATLPCEVLEILSPEGLRESLQAILKQHLGGKQYAPFEEGKNYALTEDFLQEILSPFQENSKPAKAGKETLLQWLKDNKALLEQGCKSNSNAQKTFGEVTGKPAKFLEVLRSKSSTGYVAKLFGPALDQLNEYLPFEAECELLMSALREQLHCFAIQEVTRYITLLKQRQHLMGFDDLIANLHQAFDGGGGGLNEALIQKLREKYKAVFIDEFQDTDRLQYEIFNHAFGDPEHTILFYIGDPKQSIYAWRKADIFTYFEARDSVTNLYSMNCNYRSTPAMLAAMNHFFLPQKDFDTFYFQEHAQAIRYLPVAYPPHAKQDRITIAETAAADAPMTVIRVPKREAVLQAAIIQVLRLLQPGSNIGERQILPGDIGILVRSGKEGKDIKAALAREGVPATMVDESKILESPEAQYFLYLLEAMSRPVRGNINRALLTPFTGFDTPTILQLDDAEVLDAFTRYRESWVKHGCYTAVLHFMNDFGVQEKLLHAEMGERLLTNLHQLTELLHTTQSRRNLSLTEAIAWLSRGIAGANNEGDAFEQRMESDEDAVRIVTIHKSKGLEYHIVLAPFLDFKPRSRDEFLSFRDPNTSDYKVLEKSKGSEEQLAWHAEQEEQENRRLMYVAITRAVYGCYIFRNQKQGSSTLQHFLSGIGDESIPSAHFAYADGLPALPAAPYRAAEKSVSSALRKAQNFRLQQPNWGILSFTYLNARGVQISRPKAAITADAYDNFVFSELRRGARTGDLLHYILERVYFNDDEHWEEVIGKALTRHMPGKKETWTPLLRQLLAHVLHTVLQVCGQTFSLSEVLPAQRLPEFEFYFPVQSFQSAALSGLSDETAPLLLKNFRDSLEGVMNGKLDLFFQHNGRYYILDWKSNYLGDKPEDYDQEALKEVMSSEGYHLQYHLYTLAAVRYLKTRLNDFDYERDFGGVIYLFLRGMRKGKDTGVFCCKPDWKKIEKMEAVFTGKKTEPKVAMIG